MRLEDRTEERKRDASELGSARVAAQGPGELRPTSSGYGFRALRYPGFRIYFAGMLARGTAVWMLLVTVPWLAVELGASPVELGVISALLFLPTLFIAALGGVLADRVDRGRVLFLSQVGSMLLAGLLCAAVLGGVASLPVVAVAALLFGVLTAVELPVRQAYLTELVPPADVTSAVSLHATAWNTTRFLGPILAGVLIAWSGTAASFALAALIAMVVTASVSWMERYRSFRRPRRAASAGVLADLREGAAFAARNVQVRWSLLLITAASILAIQAFQTLAPLYVLEDMGLGAGAYGMFVGLWGAGAVVAAVGVTVAARGDRRPWLVGGTLAMSLILAAIALVSQEALAFVLAFALGAAQIVLVQNALVAVQSATPDDLRGRVMGIYVTLFQGSSPLGAILAGTLAAALGIRGAMLLGAVGLAFVGLAAAVALRRAGHHARPGGAAAPGRP